MPPFLPAGTASQMDRIQLQDLLSIVPIDTEVRLMGAAILRRVGRKGMTP